MTSDEVITQLYGLAKNATDAMKAAEFTVANNIALTAISLAPEDTAKLVESIGVVDNSTVVVEAPYAAYAEFGTGQYAAEYVSTLPDEWKEEAQKFFVNGLGHGSAHPFFYPAVLRHEQELFPEIEKELAKLVP